METISVYDFAELSETAKKVALSECRPDYENEMREMDSSDIAETFSKYEKLFGVDVDVRESSQGFYWKTYNDKTDADGDNDLELWNEKGELVEQTETDWWSDDIFAETFFGFVFDNKKSYGCNVADLFVKFAEKANRETECGISKITDNEIAGYIENNKFGFFENGKKFIE